MLTYWHLYVIFNKKKVGLKIDRLYRDEGLTVFKNVRQPATEK